MERMKLLTRTLLLYLSITLLVFAGGGLVFYNELREILDEEINEQLEIEAETVAKYIKTYQRIPSQDIILGDRLLFDILRCVPEKRFSDTMLFFNEENEILPYRVYTIPLSLNGKCISCSILKMQLESEDLRDSILDALYIVT